MALRVSARLQCENAYYTNLAGKTKKQTARCLDSKSGRDQAIVIVHVANSQDGQRSLGLKASVAFGSHAVIPSGLCGVPQKMRRRRVQVVPVAIVQAPPRRDAEQSDRDSQPESGVLRPTTIDDGRNTNGAGLAAVENLQNKPNQRGKAPVERAKGTITSALVLMRHGESMWNDLKLFTGDVDIPLTEKGVMEALAGGKAVAHIEFDMIFTSRLVRSKQTALLAMTQCHRKAVPVIIRGGYYGKGKTGDDNRLRLRDAAVQSLEHAACHMIPVYADQALNERCYGDLQGLSKEAAVREFGAELVQKWRRSHDTRPPHGESLMDTQERSTRFFNETIVPRLKEGHNVLIVAHGNVLRCIIAHVSGLSAEEMLRLQVHTGVPYSYNYCGSSFAPCCILPPIDPLTNQPINRELLGLSSVVKKAGADSLI